MKLLLDENLSPLHARTLRDLGHDAVSVVECRLSGADDPVIRAYAIERSRIPLLQKDCPDGFLVSLGCQQYRFGGQIERTLKF